MGEELDVMFLLKEKLLSLRYLTILAQCVVVMCLSTTAILSGPIARYAAGKGYIVAELDVPGLLASRHHNGMSLANVEWDITYTRLEKASFPKDQLLDYLPDNSVDWIYESQQWNSSWLFDCKRYPNTPIKLKDSGNCTNVFTELPGLEQAFSYSEWDDYFTAWGGFYNELDMNKDILLFVYGVKEWDYEEAGGTNRSMSIMVASVHMHNVPRFKTSSSTDECSWRDGEIERSSYTKIVCELRRKADVLDPNNLAFPDSYRPSSVPSAYKAYYQARFTQQCTSDCPISVITPDELIRFYQTYVIIKDLQHRQPVTRRLSVRQRVVKLSTMFLSVALLVTLLIILGILQYAWFAVRHRSILTGTPQLKLDWMMQSIQTEDRPFADRKGRLRRSVTVDSTSGLAGMSSLRRKRREFEAAKYGGRATTTWFLKDSASPSEYGASPRMDEGDAIGTYHGPAQMVQGDRTPMLNVGIPTDDFYTRAM